MANIGEPLREIEVTPIQIPVTQPITPEPVKEPKRELQPA